MRSDEEEEAWKVVLFLTIGLSVAVALVGWYCITADRQRIHEMMETAAWFQKYKDVAPRLQVFMRINDYGEPVYSVTENKTLWLEGKVLILFESSDPWKATQWAADHTCIVYLENVNLTLNKPLIMGKNKYLILKNAAIRFVERKSPIPIIITVAVALTVTSVAYVINKYFIIKIEVKRRIDN